MRMKRRMRGEGKIFETIKYSEREMNRFVNAINWTVGLCNAMLNANRIKREAIKRRLEVNHSPFSLLKDFALTRTTKLPSETFSVMLA